MSHAEILANAVKENTKHLKEVKEVFVTASGRGADGYDSLIIRTNLEKLTEYQRTYLITTLNKAIKKFNEEN